MERWNYVEEANRKLQEADRKQVYSPEELCQPLDIKAQHGYIDLLFWSVVVCKTDHLWQICAHENFNDPHTMRRELNGWRAFHGHMIQLLNFPKYVLSYLENLIISTLRIPASDELSGVIAYLHKGLHWSKPLPNSIPGQLASREAANFTVQGHCFPLA